MSRAVIDALVERFPETVYDPYVGVGGDDCAFVKKEGIVEACRFLKAERGFDMAPYITAVDYLGQDPRFEVVYNLHALRTNERIRLRVKVSEQDCEIPTVTGVWRGADRFERYCFDMYGIRVAGHPDPRRLLMDEEFADQPLRKDYPLCGRRPLVREREIEDLLRGPGPAARN